MASLQEAPVWEEKIYRIQAHIDSPVGGSDGLTNLQPRQIANRTRWLLDRMGREHSLNGHLIFADEIADDAAIDGDKTLLDKTFEELHALLSECGTKLEFLREKAGEVIGRDGLKFEAVTRAQRFLWEKGAYSFGWEFFTDGLNMRQFITERPILSTVHHDDTIILEDVTGISEGDLMVVYSEGGADAEIIEVEHIICDSSTGQYRILAKDVRDPETGEILEYAINVDRNSGFIGSMSWTLDENGNGYAVPGAIYLSGMVYCLSNAHGGKLIVRFLDKSGPLRIEVNYGNGWEEIECAYNESAGIAGSDEHDAIYELAPGIFRLRAMPAGTKPANIGYMAIVPVLGSRTVDPIRKPTIELPVDNGVYAVYEMAMKSSVFRRCYRDNLKECHFAFSQDSSFPASKTYTWILPDGIDSGISASVSNMDQTGEASLHNAPLKDFFDATVDGSERVFPYGMYYMRCRHVSDVGDVSEWSDPVVFTLTEATRIFGFDGSDYTLRTGGFNASNVYEDDTLPPEEKKMNINEFSGKFRSLYSEDIPRFGFDGTSGTLGFDMGMFIKE